MWSRHLTFQDRGRTCIAAALGVTGLVWLSLPAAAQPNAQFNAFSGQHPMGGIRWDHPCAKSRMPQSPFFAECERLAASGNDPAAEFMHATILVNPADPRHNLPRGVAKLRALIEAGPHAPAAFLLAQLHGSGFVGLADYTKARALLEQAVEWESDSARALLATFLKTGLGGPADRERALAMYQKAAENGFNPAIRGIAEMLLTDNYSMKDVKRGRAILQDLEQKGAKGAAMVWGLYKRMLDGKLPPVVVPRGEEDFQVVSLPTGEHPLPPVLGFLPEIRRLHYLSFFDGRKEIGTLKARYHELITPYYFEIARHLATSDPQEALTYRMLAEVRMRYDAGRCARPEWVISAPDRWDQALGDTLRPLMINMNNLDFPAARRRALQMEAELGPGKTRPYWICGQLIDSELKAGRKPDIAAIYKPRKEWEKARIAARQYLESLPDQPPPVRWAPQ